MLHSKNIYLAEDDIDDVDFFKEALRDICPGCTLNVSGNGEELLSALQSGKPQPDIIFIDVNMPRIDGIQALILMKNCKNLCNIPVIIYSTTTNNDVIKSAYDNGAHHFFTKPASFEVLRSEVKNFLSIDWQTYIIPANT